MEKVAIGGGRGVTFQLGKRGFPSFWGLKVFPEPFCRTEDNVRGPLPKFG